MKYTVRSPDILHSLKLGLLSMRTLLIRPFLTPVDPHGISGTCHIAIVLLAQIHNHRELLPEALQPEDLFSTDIATIGEIERGVFGDLWCLEAMGGLPSGFVVGKLKSLGVFFWSPQSRISRLYRGRHTPGLLGEVFNSTDGGISTTIGRDQGGFVGNTTIE